MGGGGGGAAFVPCVASAGVSAVTFSGLWCNLGPTIANAGTSLAHHCAAISPLMLA